MAPISDPLCGCARCLAAGQAERFITRCFAVAFRRYRGVPCTTDATQPRCDQALSWKTVICRCAFTAAVIVTGIACVYAGEARALNQRLAGIAQLVVEPLVSGRSSFRVRLSAPVLELRCASADRSRGGWCRRKNSGCPKKVSRAGCGGVEIRPHEAYIDENEGSQESLRRRAVIKVQNLTKAFGPKIAVNDLSSPSSAAKPRFPRADGAGSRRRWAW